MNEDLGNAAIVLVSVIVFVLAVLGSILLASDLRYFADIKKQCTELGYIQNKYERITCRPETTEK